MCWMGSSLVSRIPVDVSRGVGEALAMGAIEPRRAMERANRIAVMFRARCGAVLIAEEV